MKFLRRFFVSKRRKEKLQEFAQLVHEVKRIASVHECGVAMKAVIKFREGLDDDDPLNQLSMHLVEFIIDTRNHAKDGYHRCGRTNWQMKTTYPDINDYIKLGYRIKKF